jgi:hypothetical protein
LRHLSDITIPATGRPSLLLTALPWELRDQIYEYALIEEGGVVKDDVFTTEGAGRFYAAGEFNTITPLDTFYHWACLVATKNFHGFTNSTTGNTSKTDANRLKFVCRQLYAETKGLGLLFNDLTFYGRSDNPSNMGSRLWATFLAMEHSASQRARIKQVTIIDEQRPAPYRGRSPKPRMIHLSSPSFTSLYNVNPQVAISVLLDEFVGGSMNLYEWPYQGRILQSLLHGTVPNALPTTEAQRYLEDPRRITIMRYGGLISLPANVRFFPAGFDEGRIMRSADSGRDEETKTAWMK